MRYAHVGNEVWVGEYTACDAHSHEFDLQIHIWKRYNWKENRFCKRCHASTEPHTGPGIAIRWTEGERLAQMSMPLEEVVAYCRRPGPLFIHCAGGVCRSTTLALVAKVARGQDVFDAIRQIYLCLWEEYGNPPAWVPKTIEDVLHWAYGTEPKLD